MRGGPHDHDHDVINPATEEVIEPSSSRARAGRRRHRAGESPPRPGARPPAAAAALLRPRRRAPGGARAARGRQFRPHHRQRALGGRQRPGRPRTTTRPRPSGTSAGRSRSPAASTSPSRSRSASSASSSRGTSPCRSRAGGSRRPSAGNTVVLKPAELTPLTAMRLGELALEAGCPRTSSPSPGQGPVVGGGSSPTPPCARSASPAPPPSGSGIMPGCADQVKRVTLELGGKSANIVFADADLEKAAARRRTASSTTPARTAAPAARILVERSVLDRLPRALRGGGPGVGRHRPRRRDARWVR